MNAAELLKIALDHAKSESALSYSGKVVYLYFNGESEYTTVAEENIDKLPAEDKKELVAKFYNGETLVDAL